MTMATTPATGLGPAPGMAPGAVPISSAHSISAPIPTSVIVPMPGPMIDPAAIPTTVTPAPTTTKTTASNLSEVDRGRIVGMWEAGRKPSAIALAIPCSKRTACKWINAYRNCGKEGLVDLRRSGLAGRPRKTTEDENAAIIRVMDEGRSRAATSSALAALKLSVSDRTIRRRLQEARAERRKRVTHSRSSRVKLVSGQNNKRQGLNSNKAPVFNPPGAQTMPVVGQLKETMTMHEAIEPSTLVEVNMGTHTPPLDGHLLGDTGPCCYVNL